jgi:hypothetical protein
MCLFNTHYTKSARLEELEQTQVRRSQDDGGEGGGMRRGTQGEQGSATARPTARPGP